MCERVVLQLTFFIVPVMPPPAPTVSKSTNLADELWNLAKQTSMTAFEKGLAALGVDNPGAFEYLTSKDKNGNARFPKDTWSQAHIIDAGHRTDGILTNNNSESGNNRNDHNKIRMVCAHESAHLFLSVQDEFVRTTLEKIQELQENDISVDPKTQAVLDNARSRLGEYTVSQNGREFMNIRHNQTGRISVVVPGEGEWKCLGGDCKLPQQRYVSLCVCLFLSVVVCGCMYLCMCL
jgi:hypothetical protein